MQLFGAVEGGFQLGNLLLQLVDGLGLLQDILFVDIPQLDFRHVICLNFINPKANHQVGHHFLFQFRLPDDGDGLINIQQNPLQSLEQMEPVLLFLNLEVKAAADALGAPGCPLLQNLTHTHYPGHSGNENVEITGEAVLQGCQAEQLLHQLFRLHSPLQINGQLQAAQIRFVPHICDFLDFPRLD